MSRHITLFLHHPADSGWPIIDTFTDTNGTLLEDHLSDDGYEWRWEFGKPVIITSNQAVIADARLSTLAILHVPLGRAKNISATITQATQWTVSTGIALRVASDASSYIQALGWQNRAGYQLSYTQARIYEEGTHRASGTSRSGTAVFGTYNHIVTDDEINTITCDCTDASPLLGIATWSAAGAGTDANRHLGLCALGTTGWAAMSWDNLTATL